MSDREFDEWFHAEWLAQNGPVNPESTFSRQKHRETKLWAQAAWTEALLRSTRERLAAVPA